MTRLRQLTYGALLLAAIAGLLITQHQRVQLAQAATDRATDRAEQAEQQSARRQAAIDELANELASERRAQSALRTQQSQIRQQLAERQQTIKDLTHENQQLRDWAATELPAAARRLRTRPAITGAADYQAWLSDSGAVHAAGDQPQRQRRTAD